MFHRLLEAEGEHDQDDADLGKATNELMWLFWQDAEIHEHSTNCEKVENRGKSGMASRIDGNEHASPDESKVC